MKIVNRKTFLALPTGTLYSKYRPCIFDDLLIKERTVGNDWYYQSIADAIDVEDSGQFGEVLCRAEGTGESIPMDLYCLSRDGLFDADQLFAVWERQDIETLINRISTAYMDCVRAGKVTTGKK